MYSQQDSFVLFTEFLYKRMEYTSHFGVALNGAIVCLNQQRKFSSFGRSSVSQKHTSTCVSVHGEGQSCQGCHIHVGCQLFKTLVIEYEQFQGLYGILFLRESCLYSSDSAVVQCQVLV